MKILHICDGWETTNGAANIARLIAGEQTSAGHEIAYRRWARIGELRAANEVWIHCGWKPCLWWAAFVVAFIRTFARQNARPFLFWVPEACYDPVRRRFHGWKKTLVGPIERWALRRCDRIVATCEAEREWIADYVGAGCPEVVVTDIKRFFRLGGAHAERDDARDARRVGYGQGLNLLYLGRRHPLKGVEYLEAAVSELKRSGDRFSAENGSGDRFTTEIELRLVSNAFGDEKEKVWDWCDVLCLPTLSDNFGLVVAEALERGKRVVVTDGAPAWDPARLTSAVSSPKSHVSCPTREGSLASGFGGRLLYVRGYRDGDAATRVRLLKEAIESLGTAS